MNNLTAMQTISEDRLQRIVPSIFSNNHSENLSGRYKHINTIEIVRGLANEGYMPVDAFQTRSRTPQKREFAKHLIRFRHVDSNPQLGGLFPELILTNSHDGLSAYKLMAGLYRIVCSNGLIAGDTYSQVKVRHQGDIISQVINGTFEVMKSAEQIVQSSAQMGLIELDREEKRIFANAVHTLRFDDDKTLAKEAIRPEQFLEPRRWQERNANDLFTIFNVAQENVIKGGLHGRTRDEKGILKHVSTRAIKAIDQTTSLNRALWTLAEEMAKYKGVNLENAA
jgi:hypothetical protein